jgi:hypothetical protein
LNVYGCRITADITATVEPHAVHRHYMRTAVTPDGRKPVMQRVDQPLLNRSPIKEAIGAPVAARQSQLLSNGFRSHDGRDYRYSSMAPSSTDLDLAPLNALTSSPPT